MTPLWQLDAPADLAAIRRGGSRCLTNLAQNELVVSTGAPILVGG